MTVIRKEHTAGLKRWRLVWDKYEGHYIELRNADGHEPPNVTKRPFPNEVEAAAAFERIVKRHPAKTD